MVKRLSPAYAWWDADCPQAGLNAAKTARKMVLICFTLLCFLRVIPKHVAHVHHVEGGVYVLYLSGGQLDVFRSDVFFQSA